MSNPKGLDLVPQFSSLAEQIEAILADPKKRFEVVYYPVDEKSGLEIVIHIFKDGWTREDFGKVSAREARRTEKSPIILSATFETSSAENVRGIDISLHEDNIDALFRLNGKTIIFARLSDLGRLLVRLATMFNGKYLSLTRGPKGEVTDIDIVNERYPGAQYLDVDIRAYNPNKEGEVSFTFGEALEEAIKAAESLLSKGGAAGEKVAKPTKE